MDTPHDEQTQWTTYESNVQNYRGLGMSTQSILLAVGAIILGQHQRFTFAALAVIAEIVTWFIFFPSIFARTAIVDFHKFEMAQKFDRFANPKAADGPRPDPGDQNAHLLEKEYAKVSLSGVRLRRKVNEELSQRNLIKYGPSAERFRTLRMTRRNFDVIVPALFTLVWIVFTVQSFAYSGDGSG